MKTSEIFGILNLAAKVRANGETFNPLFSGPPGVGKSHIVQQWCRENGYEYIDLRAAYLEAPDVRGFPIIVTDDKGRQRMATATPDSFPDEGKGIIFLDEVNRGTTSVMNCFMQLLSDGKIDRWIMPKGWFVVAAINPDGGASYDTNPMDPAFRDRFVEFKVEYDKVALVEFMKASDYHEDLINWVDSGLFKYTTPEVIANSNVNGVQYNSPRTIAKVNAVLQAGLPKTMELMVFNAILGNALGKDFYDFRHNETPVMMRDIDADLKRALTKIKRYTDPADYKNGLLSITTKDIVDVNTITDDVLAKVVEALSVEQSTNLIHRLEIKRKDKTILDRLAKNYPQLVDVFKNVVKFQGAKK